MKELTRLSTRYPLTVLVAAVIAILWTSPSGVAAQSFTRGWLGAGVLVAPNRWDGFVFEAAAESKSLSLSARAAALAHMITDVQEPAEERAVLLGAALRGRRVGFGAAGGPGFVSGLERRYPNTPDRSVRRYSVVGLAVEGRALVPLSDGFALTLAGMGNANKKHSWLGLGLMLAYMWPDPVDR